MTRDEEILKQVIKEQSPEWRAGFISGANWADETMIKKACEWLKNELFEDVAEPNPYYYNDIKSKTYDFLEDFIKEFCKAMKGE